MSDAVIAGAAGPYPIETLGRAFGVAVRGYYAWRGRPPSAHQQADQLLLSPIQTADVVSRGLYGSPRVHAPRRGHGIPCARQRVARRLRQAGLRARRRAARPIRTTDSRPTRPVAPTLVQPDFSATGPDPKWLGDSLGIWTAEGGRFLAA